MPGAIRTRIKMHRKAMNGTVCRTKMDKMSQIHGQAVVRTNVTNIVKDLATIVHRLLNHRKFKYERLRITMQINRFNFKPFHRFSKNASNNYRGRSNGSYNNGNNTGNGVVNPRTNGNVNSSSFYRNNDNTFYQNGSRADKSSDNKNGGSDVKNFSANRYNRNPQRNNSNNATSQSSNSKKNFNFMR